MISVCPSVFSCLYEQVVLNEGDILYHPAGIWHQVECTTDSVSINVSLIASTYADVFTDALKTML